MKFLVFLALVSVAAAQFRAQGRSAQKPEDVTIVRSENENSGDGTYRFLWETSDGSKHEESGYLKPNPDPKEEAIQVAQGSFQYYSPEGELIQVQYLADENGFQPEGQHLPTPPPIPAEIQKSLDIIYAGVRNQASAPVPSRVAPPSGFRPPQHRRH